MTIEYCERIYLHKRPDGSPVEALSLTDTMAVYSKDGWEYVSSLILPQEPFIHNGVEREQPTVERLIFKRKARPKADCKIHGPDCNVPGCSSRCGTPGCKYQRGHLGNCVV